VTGTGSTWGGDRQLNHAPHMIAITRARYHPATSAYLARKEAEGKTNKGALRRLKRHLARRFHQLLSPSLQPRPKQHDTTRTDTTTVGAAPMPMVCLT
jgi:hypothetical protein